jgi:hypothetical protein
MLRPGTVPKDRQYKTGGEQVIKELLLLRNIEYIIKRIRKEMRDSEREREIERERVSSRLYPPTNSSKLANNNELLLHGHVYTSFFSSLCDRQNDDDIYGTYHVGLTAGIGNTRLFQQRHDEWLGASRQDIQSGMCVRETTGGGGGRCRWHHNVGSTSCLGCCCFHIILLRVRLHY